MPPLRLLTSSGSALIEPTGRLRPRLLAAAAEDALRSPG